jgi:putative FmdB family regulatory protein
MPLYEYECDVCAHRFEVIQKFSDPHPSACPKCAGAVTKLMSSPAIQFKGSGFYLTDYGRGGKTDNANAKAGKSESGSSGGGDSKSSDGTTSEGNASGSKPAPSKSTENTSSASTSSDGGSSTKSDSGSSTKPSAPAKAD